MLRSVVRLTHIGDVTIVGLDGSIPFRADESTGIAKEDDWTGSAVLYGARNACPCPSVLAMHVLALLSLPLSLPLRNACPCPSGAIGAMTAMGAIATVTSSNAGPSPRSCLCIRLRSILAIAVAATIPGSSAGQDLPGQRMARVRPVSSAKIQTGDDAPGTSKTRPSDDFPSITLTEGLPIIVITLIFVYPSQLTRLGNRRTESTGTSHGS